MYSKDTDTRFRNMKTTGPSIESKGKAPYDAGGGFRVETWVVVDKN